MRLIDAYNLLVDDGISDNHRYFAEVYKAFQYTDEDSLADYVDFIVHEPLHWMQGFPAKLTTKTSFSKPKTAIIKLLKKSQVQEDLGADVADAAYSVIWNTFKKEHETLLKEREGRKNGNRFRTVVEHMDRRSTGTQESAEVTVNPRMILDDAAAEILSDVGSEADMEPVPFPLGSQDHADIPAHVYLSPGMPTTKVTPWNECIASLPRRPLFDEEESKKDQERVTILKNVLHHFASTLPPGVSDAFRALVDAV